MGRTMTLFKAINLLGHYGYLTREEVDKGCKHALNNSRRWTYHTGRVEVFTNTEVIILRYSDDDEDAFVLTEKEIPELGE